MIHNKVMGSVIDVIEYYLTARQYSKDVYLAFFPYNNETLYHDYRSKIIDLIKSKYLNLPDNFENNILKIKKFDLPKIRPDKLIIFDWGSIPRLKGFLAFAHKLIIISELSEPEYMVDKNKYNVVYYGEMPFVYKDYPYRMKFAFDLYPRLKQVKKGLYINSPNNDYLQDKNILSYLNNFQYEENQIFKKSGTHKDNLFEHFDHYLYYHANKYFDTHPRLFHECYFYNKKITYVNEYNIKDGSYYRYQDLLKTGLENRILGEGDEIIQELLT